MVSPRISPTCTGHAMQAACTNGAMFADQDERVQFVDRKYWTIVRPGIVFDKRVTGVFYSMRIDAVGK